MKEAQCPEMIEKSIFPFLCFIVMIDFVQKINRKTDQFGVKNDHISKSQNRKTYCSFVSAY